MSKSKDLARLCDLQEALMSRGLSQAEEDEMDRLIEKEKNSAIQLDVGSATTNQIEYIKELLDIVGDDISSYADCELNELSFDDASDIIDNIKDDISCI